jgi:lipid-A-disaccharide synthase
MIVAGEASGDLHGGALASALFARDSTLEIIGFGGTKMRLAGVEIKFDIARLGIVGIVEVLAHFKTILTAHRMAKTLLASGVDLLVLIDYPDFNLRLARAAKRLGIPVAYYISPQVWAWRAGRVREIALCVDRMLVILPFEKAIYDAAGVSCEFVGHPLLDETRPQVVKEDYLESHGLSPSGVTVCLLPGSREKEVTRHLPVMLAAMEALAQEFPGLQLLIPVAPSLSTGFLASVAYPGTVPIRWVSGVYEALGSCDVAVVKSGTSTLQVALAGVPMIILYKLSAITHWIIRRLIRIPAIGLVNIVAGKTVVPELIQSDASADRICAEVARLLRDSAVREAMKQGLRAVSSRLGNPGAAWRVAEVICGMLQDAPPAMGATPAKGTI